MKRITLWLATSAMILAAACKDQTPPVKPPPAKPAPPPAPKPIVDGGAKDAHHLGMMEKYAIWKAKKEADEKLAAQLAAEEKARLIKFDKSHLSKHLAMFAFEKKTRQALDEAAEKLNGQIDAADRLKKLAASQHKAIEKEAATLRAMDPKGGSSNIGTDHDVYLNLLATDYPDAILQFFDGKTKPLADIRAELDKREKKISSWLEEVKNTQETKPAKEAKPAKAAKPAKPAKPAKAAKAGKAAKDSTK